VPPWNVGARRRTTPQVTVHRPAGQDHFLSPLNIQANCMLAMSQMIIIIAIGQMNLPSARLVAWVALSTTSL
jgi:hypothetical protein